MEHITLGQIAAGIALIGGIITGVTLMSRSIKNWVEALLNDKFNAIDLRLDTLTERVEEVSMDNAKNYITTCLQELEMGQSIEYQRFWEVFDYYTQHGGNSYIREHVNTLKERGIL